MEFGRIDASSLDLIDFTLPRNSEHTLKVLSKNEGENKFNVFVGCAKWGRKDWVGKIYPKGTKEKDFLEAYGKQFNSIEFNAIFYKLPSHQQIQVWRSKVPADFLFCPKFTDVITHIKRLRNAKHEVDLLLDVLFEFGEQLGPIFLMPHPQMGPKHEETITAFLLELPKEIKVFLELRHPDWFKNETYTYLFERCMQMNVGTVITDTAGRRDCVHMELTTKEVFVRFVGNSLHKSDYARIDSWIERIEEWRAKGLNTVYFYMHQHEELFSPELAKYLIEQLNDKLNLTIKVPRFVGDDKNELF
jgi:uncharacterized protein YecE (DUF72 family)